MQNKGEAGQLRHLRRRLRAVDNYQGDALLTHIPRALRDEVDRDESAVAGLPILQNRNQAWQSLKDNFTSY